MESIKSKIAQIAVKEGLKYIGKNTQENTTKLINLVEKFAVLEDQKKALEWVKYNIADEESIPAQFIDRIYKELNPKCREKLLTNFLVQSYFIGRVKAEENEKKYNCKIPWAILIDPTSACNLKCKGCWAAEYNKNDSLSYEQLDRIITEGKELGIYAYLYSGGEPLVRKNDLIKLAEKHDDCIFLAFTNGTLVDEQFAKDLARVGNFTLAFSAEGFEEETDLRRGENSYKNIMKAMDMLKKEGILFGFSTCYHSKNVDVVSSDAYVDSLIEKGCMYGWYFTYMPLGKDAVIELICSPDEREKMYHAVREFRKTKPMFILDFWNDGEYVQGCIAGGRNYFHINANGDVEPCAFIHYSNVNIKDVSLIEALQCDLFKEYQKGQPFNGNHLMPCPLLDNPDKLREMVNKANAKSTQPLDKETVEDLTDKCIEPSRIWKVTADRLWDEKDKEKEERAEAIS
ncbi:MAG: radical SAM protein [Clostridiales bacterium]|nr:radical SAM protein [Clostridiales bacterium]